ncbi:ricin-type beta-trefoil lectin domain protein [Dactylosporangium vinaceum]|uniref:Ricin-type beta-trefoil lectin domain protein n=1 Tax=Dactylosporangium vinaceum TaxID=53362 RepID=A0ABV5M1X3_9ACTN|nr:ricin-type beta-trefoil lectin domain protein [Dactylosporangium vinaceum]UAB99311.1 ricin-type beta-trefoil lectin domain protein [Dactylosporangium vinaceum]
MRIRLRYAIAAAAAATLGAAGFIVAPDALAAAETVNVWLTTTSDAGGRTVTRGLAQQPAVAFSAGTGSSAQTITVNDATRYQTFAGGGASFTDTAAWLMNSSGALSAGTRSTVMQKLFDPVNGIGVSFLRNPMGASDLARSGYSYDDRPAGQTDPGLAGFSISHDLADVLPLTKQAQQLNPQLTTMASPWTAPGWMKDSGSLNGGWLQAQYYAAYAQYFVKYIQAYQAQGVKVDFVTPQNEPTCCAGYPSMSWNGNGLDFFVGSNLLPALHAAGLSTKVLVHDWNWDVYDAYAAQAVNDAAIRNDSLFGGIAWHGYGGDVTKQTTVHNQYPALDAYSTEHSGGTWIANQQQEDMLNMIDYGRNWSKSFTKWSLAVDQNMGPHYGGCGTCTGLITVHNGDSRSGQVDYTIEYYTMGHLTKFVRPGAWRVDSTANGSVPNIAYLNQDGTRALIAYNNTASTQQVTVNWSGQHFTYSLPTKTSATFTWKSGVSGGGGGGSRTGAITGLGGKCVDVAGASTANGTAVQMYTCNGSGAQQWTIGTDGTVRALGKCLDVTGANAADGTKVQLYDCNGSAAQTWAAGSDGTLRSLGKCLDVSDNSTADGARLQIWTCFAGANQRWTLPA